MSFRVFKRLTAALKTKVSSRKCHRSGPTWTHSSTDRSTLKRIMVFGDSNAFCPDNNNTCWPALLEDKDPLHLNVFNESRDGRTTRYDIGEFDGLRVIGSKLTARAPLDYVVVMLGTNDMKSTYGPPSVADIVDGMRQILDVIDLHSGGAKPILLTPPPLGNVTSGELAGAQSRIPPIAAEYRLLAMDRDTRLVDIHALIDIAADLGSDMIHLNAAGRHKVANAVWANLQDVTQPPQVEGLSGMHSGPNFILTWSPVGFGTFYYRVRRNGDIISRTMDTSCKVNEATIGNTFTVEAVDFSQNTGTSAVPVNCNESGNSMATAAASSISLR